MGLPIKKGSTVFAAFVLFFALCISGVAAWYSIVGLMAIFSGAALAIAIMGGVLEVGKLVAASWLYNNWSRAPLLMKGYLTTAIVVLMFITSMGIFGFLSKAHLEQVGPTGNHQAKVEKLEFDIAQQEKRIGRANDVLDQLEAGLQRYIDLGFVTRGLKERAKQKEERHLLDAEIAAATTRIDQLSELKFEEQKEIRGLEAEVGPIKYIAALVYSDDADQHIDEAVRWMIILLIFVFDPLAVLLVIAGNMSFAYARPEVRAPPSSDFKIMYPHDIQTDEEAAALDAQMASLQGKNRASPAMIERVKKSLVRRREQQEEEEEENYDRDPDHISDFGEIIKEIDLDLLGASAGIDAIADPPEGNFKEEEEEEEEEDLITPPPEQKPPETATNAEGGALSVEIEVVEPQPYWIDEAVDQVFKKADMPFNLEGPDGHRLKQLLLRTLKKNKI